MLETLSSCSVECIVGRVPPRLPSVARWSGHRVGGSSQHSASIRSRTTRVRNPETIRLEAGPNSGGTFFGTVA